MRVGFLGLGAMGAHMARNLHKAGLLTAVWNRTRPKAQELATELAEGPQVAMRFLKRSLRNAVTLSFEQAGEARAKLRLRHPQLGREAGVAQPPGAFAVAEAEDIEQRLLDVVLA